MSLAPARVLLCGCLVLACSAPAPAPEQAPPAEVAAPAPPVAVAKVEVQAPEPAPAPAPEPAPAPAGDEEVGVAACDAYADRYRTCIAERVAAGEQDRHRQVLQAQLASWLAAKADPELAPALDEECAAAAVAARASTRALGCVWREGDAAKPEPPKGGRLKPEIVTEPRRMFPPGDPFGDL